MHIIMKAILWAMLIMAVASAGAMGWIDKAVAAAWVGTLPALAVVHLTALRRNSCLKAKG